MAIILDGALSETALLDAAGDAVYERGEDCIDDVSITSTSTGGTTATVTSTVSHDVRLTWRGDGIDGTCTCPYFPDHGFCEHMVAVGLTALSHARDTIIVPDRPAATALTPESATAVETYLEGLYDEELRDLVLTLASASPNALRALENAAGLALDGADAADADDIELMATARSLTSIHDVLDYYEADAYAGEINDFLDELEPLLDDPEGADSAAPALLHIATRLRAQLENSIDDSSGAVSNTCQSAIDLYARACCEGNPDGAELGLWLADFRLTSPGWPNIALNDFLPALGEEGLAEYRRIVNAAARQAGDEGRARDYELTGMLLELADHDDDVDRAIDLLSGGARPRYAAMIERLLAAGRRREAMACLDCAVADSQVIGANLRYWAAAGTSYEVDPARAVDLYLEDGRSEDALALARGLFRSSPTPETLDFLLATAERLDRREEEQRAALEWAESQDWRTGDTVITLALHIDDVDRAWAAADRWGADCTWQALADAEPQPRPDDAIDLYRHRVKEVLRKTGRPSAQQAVAMASCMRRIAGREEVICMGNENGLLHAADRRHGGRPARRPAPESLQRLGRRPAGDLPAPPDRARRARPRGSVRTGGPPAPGARHAPHIPNLLQALDAAARPGDPPQADRARTHRSAVSSR